MSAWSLWISGVSVYEGNAINGVASGSVRLYNSDFSFPSFCQFQMLSYVTLEISLWRKLKGGGAFFSVIFPPSSNRGQGMCAVRS